MQSGRSFGRFDEQYRPEQIAMSNKTPTAATMAGGTGRPVKKPRQYQIVG